MRHLPLLILSGFLTLAACDTTDAVSEEQNFVPGEVLVQLQSRASLTDFRAFVDEDPELEWKRLTSERAKIVLLGVEEGEELAQVERLEREVSGYVLYAQVNHYVSGR